MSRKMRNPIHDENVNENHMQMFHRLVAAGARGMHNPPQPRTKKAH